MATRTLETCRDDFPALSRTHAGRPLAYLDGPAGSQVPAAVIEAIAGYYRTCNANHDGQFVTSRESDALVARARGAVATFLGAPGPQCISFGANMTTLTYSLSHALARAWQPGDEVVITALDHEANRGPWLGLRERGIVVREVAITPEGRLDHDDFARQVTSRTKLVALGAASNALGTVNDLAFARRLASDAGALLSVDAVHYAPHFALDVAAMDADFVLCSAYKFYGPHVGVLYSRPGLLELLEPDRLRVQDQAAPCRIETGTLNHAALAGVLAAVEYVASRGEGPDLRARLEDAFEAIGRHESALARRYYERVGAIDGVTLHGPGFDAGPRAPTVSLSIDGVRPELAAARLGDQGIQVWDGHFYAVRVVEALGLAAAGGLLRAGVLMYNTEEEIDRLVAGVAALARSR